MAIQLGSAYGKVIVKDEVSPNIRSATKSVDGLSDNFLKASRTIATGAALITGEIVILKKAFDFGKEGAAVLQAGESWDTLLEKIGAAPDLLNQLRTASRGTIDDLKLMNSTSLLLAGTQGDLATALASASPHLVEIAKAAQKLNPSLGDTTFLYDSLARGIKRSSPLILDNLGLIIKVEEANRAYAESLGISADKLTAEQQKIALLNEVMRAGNVLIDQAGGNVDSATDAFSRMEVSVTNAGNALKTKFAPALADAADGVYWLLNYTSDLNAAYNEHINQVQKTARSYEAYTAEVVRSGVLTGRITEQQAGEIYKLVFAHDDLNDMNEKEKRILGELLTAIGLVTRADFDLTRATQDATDAEAGHKTKLSETKRAMLELAGAADILGMSMDDLSTIVNGQLGPEMEDYSKQNQELAEKTSDLREQIRKLESQKWLSPKQKEELEKLRGELGETGEAVTALADEHNEATKRMLFDILTQQAAADGLTQTEVNALTSIATQWGLVDDATATAMGAASDFFANLDEGTALSIQQIALLKQRMLGLPTAHTFTLTVRERRIAGGTAADLYEPGPGVPLPPGGELEPGLVPGGARGLHGFIPPGYPGDSFLMAGSSGERVDITPAGQQTPAGDTFNITLTINGNADPEGVKRAAYIGVMDAARAKGLR